MSHAAWYVLAGHHKPQSQVYEAYLCSQDAFSSMYQWNMQHSVLSQQRQRALLLAAKTKHMQHHCATMEPRFMFMLMPRYLLDYVTGYHS